MITKTPNSDELDARATSSNRMSLTDAVNYTDTFGRTSCGTSEFEHYQLRALGLAQAMKILTETIDRLTREQLVLGEWLQVNRKRDSANASELAVLNKLEDMTPTTAIRRINSIIAEKHRAQLKDSRLKGPAEIMFKKHWQLVCARYSGLIETILPQELQDMILEHLVLGAGKFVVCWNGCKSFSFELSEGEERKDLVERWCFDSAILGESLARDALKVFLRKAVFLVDADQAMEDALAGDLGGQKLSVAPQDCIQDIVVVLPRRYLDIRQSNSFKSRERLHMLLRVMAALKTLKNCKASITFSLTKRLGHPCYWLKQCLSRRSTDFVDFPSLYSDDVSLSARHDRNTLLQLETFRPLKPITVTRTLEPLLSELVSRGHTIHIEVDHNFWRWTGQSAKVKVEA